MGGGHAVTDERPVAADLDGVAVARALHRFGQGVELANLDALGGQHHEGLWFRLGRLGPRLLRVLEPLLILRRLLPALIRRAGADQVDIRAEVLAVLAGLETGAVGTE